MVKKEEKTLGIAIVGCGTVGAAAAALLTDDQSIIKSKVAIPMELRYIVDIDFSHARKCGLDESLFTNSIDVPINDDSVQIIVELVGGLTFAKELIEKALMAGKHVVTANKALLAHHGAELYAVARENGVSIAFEASCAGGIPIIRAMNEGLAANRIDAIFGIVNGTCNFILTEMISKNKSYSDALADAQRDGLAETDPTLDVSGGDSAHKLAIMASLGFGMKIDFDKIPIKGIDTLELCDVGFGETLGYVIKLLAIAERQDDGISLRVRPAFISKSHPLAWVSGPFNAVSVYGHVTGHTMYYGRGAGANPTASAVVADIISIGIGTAQRAFELLNVWADQAKPANQLPFDKVESRYYMRITCADKAGVLAQIAEVLGKHNISITSLLQHDFARPDVSAVPVIITTHKAREGNIRKALAEIDALDVIKAKSVCIGIVEEYPEEI